MDEPILEKPIPTQVINAGAAYGPFDLKAFIQSPDQSPLKFVAQTVEGAAIPKGLICTEDGVLTGIPAKETEGNYELQVTATNDNGKIDAKFLLVIKPSLIVGANEYADKLKSQIWEALEKRLPIPDIGQLLEREITPVDIYYLLERWGTLVIFDAFNLEPPGEKKLIELKGVSQHYNVYDRGSCLIGAPKDLYSYERTIADGIQTAKVMAGEVYNRRWTVELVGIDKLTRAAWVEIQRLGNINGRLLEVINYNPTPDDVKIYTTQMLGPE